MTKQKPLERLIERWNQIPGVRPCRVANAKRRKQLAARMKEKWWLEHCRESLERVEKSSFCRGHNDRGWLADIDWFLRPGTVAGLVEGKYDDRTGNGAVKTDYDFEGTP